jgi:hypothetical protein
MKIWKQVFAHLAWGGIVICGLQAGSEASFAQQRSREANVEQARLEKGAVGIEDLPDSPGATLAQQQNQEPASGAQQTPSPANPPSQPNSQTSDPQFSTPQPAAPASQAPSTSAPAQRPVGTAAAETATVSGVAASQPAGVAIAPAKQRRVRTMVLRMGAIVGAGVAVGTVVALTAATPSKPPGAH